MNLTTSIEMCRVLIEETVPLTLIYYSHVGLATVALLIAGFIIWHNRTRTGILLFALAGFFASWAIIDIFLWTAVDSRVYMYLWPIANILESFIFVTAFLFFFAFTGEGKDSLSRIFGFLLLLPVIAFAWTSHNLSYFDIASCIPIEGWFWGAYIYPLQQILTAWIFIVGLYKAFRMPKGLKRQTTLLMTIGLTLFLASFLLAGWLVDLADFNYIYEILAFIGTAVFLWFLSYLIVRYNSFNIKVLAAQALVFGLVAAIAAQFLFIRNPVNYFLNAVSLVLVIVFGILLIRSVRAEIVQRELAENLASELDKANKQQIILIHFITHQIKGFLTKSRNIFSMALDGDFGQVPDSMKPMLAQGLESDTKGVDTIQEILNAANIKSGKVTYSMSELDLKMLVEGVANDLRSAAEKKGLQLVLELGEEPVMVAGDRLQLVNALKNLIDNSIKYTPSGSVTVSLVKESGKIRFVVKDTGVGITPEDMQKLFTEGGHGANSQKVNVESTGFGLYIVKNIIEAHHGRVWAESDGEGKGSRFIAEFPA